MKALYLRFHKERDKDLIEWLKALEDLPYGAKSQTIKEVLRRGIRESEAAAQTEALPFDVDTVQEAVVAAIAQALDLTTIRSVVEVAVRSVLAEANIHVAQYADENEDDEGDEMLDMLGDELLM